MSYIDMCCINCVVYNSSNGSFKDFDYNNIKIVNIYGQEERERERKLKKEKYD